MTAPAGTTASTPLVPAQRSGGRAVLVVDDDDMILALVSAGLGAAGYSVTTASSGSQALQRLAEAIPDLVVSDVNMPDMDGFSLVQHVRSDARLQSLPLVFLTSRAASADVVSGLQLGADDYLTKPFDLRVLLARVEAKTSRVPVPVADLRDDRRTGLVGAEGFLRAADRERQRAERSGRQGFVAVLGVHESDSVRLRFGPRALDELALQIASSLSESVGPLELAGRTADGRFALLLPETDAAGVRARLQELTERLARQPLRVGGEPLHVTGLVGYADLTEGADVEQALQWAGYALDEATHHLDLRPVGFEPVMLPAYAEEHGPSRAPRPLLERLRTPGQVLATLVIGWFLPFLLYLFSDRAGVPVAPVAYLVVVLALLVTGVSIWVEGMLALEPVQPPPAPQEEDEDLPWPAASAVIAAYLPNEAATVVETVESFLRLDYPGDLQVVLAYNTPHDLPVEAVLAQVARRDPRFVPLRVAGSTSKAQNVNAALGVVTGRFTGVFDADHHPDPDSYRRAWRWLADGHDVVQGHAVVRNGDASWVARTIAVEFEAIYAVAHPGRARLHGFGIFGGSNGYWRTDLLRETRFRGSMLTEDIDSSLRVVEAGYRIGSDPYLVSRELAPTTLGALWDQRMRWAQGWFQVSLGHLAGALRNPRLTLRQKLGFTFLLGWRELYPWLSVQMFPILAFYGYKAGGLQELDYLIPVFVLTTLFTLSVGPFQTLFAYRQADPALRERTAWFWLYLLMASLWYTEYKNVIARVAQVKQFMREKAWKVTPRAASTAGAAHVAVQVDAAGPSANDPQRPPVDETLAPPPLGPA